MSVKFEELQTLVISWSRARSIIPNSTAVAQSRKTLEESGEMLEAAARRRVLFELTEADPTLADNAAVINLRALALGEFQDGVGDVLVTVINACALAGVDPNECLAGAYDEIKDRRGTMNAAGIFVKEPAA